jgi:hypothetical protein
MLSAAKGGFMRALLTLVSLLALLQTTAPAQEQQSGLIEIDGAKTPELIPEWYRWESLFRQLAGSGEHADDHYSRPEHGDRLRDFIDISPQEWGLLMAEAKRYQVHDAQMFEQYRREARDLEARGFERKTIAERLRQEEVADRSGLLTARDRLERQFSAAGWTNLERYLLEHIARKSKAFLGGEDVQRFQIPR